MPQAIHNGNKVKKRATTRYNAPVSTKSGNASKIASRQIRTPTSSNNAQKNTTKQKSVPVTQRKETFPHFRMYKKSKHPALIVGERTKNKNDKIIEEYKFRKVMHSKRDGKRLNEEVFPNPKPTDPEPMQIAKAIKYDNKKCFGKKLPWEYKKSSTPQSPASKPPVNRH